MSKTCAEVFSSLQIPEFPSLCSSFFMKLLLHIYPLITAKIIVLDSTFPARCSVKYVLPHLCRFRLNQIPQDKELGTFYMTRRQIWRDQSTSVNWATIPLYMSRSEYSRLNNGNFNSSVLEQDRNRMRAEGGEKEGEKKSFCIPEWKLIEYVSSLQPQGLSWVKETPFCLSQWQHLR